MFAIPGFARVVLVGGLVVGAHAMHDAFAMILWAGAGIAPAVAGTAGLSSFTIRGGSAELSNRWSGSLGEALAGTYPVGCGRGIPGPVG